MYKLAFALIIATLSATAQVDTTKPLEVAEKVMDANLISSAPAVRPPLADMAGVRGDVTFKAIIDKEGHVVNLQLMSGPPLLVNAAMTSVKSRVYTPMLVNGDPVPVITTVTIRL